VLGGLSMIFEETEVAVVRVAHVPESWARCLAAGRRQDQHDYSYCGLEQGSTQEIVVFGVDNVTRAASLLDELAAESA